MGVKDVGTSSPVEYKLWRAADLRQQGKWLHAVQIYDELLQELPELTEASVQLASIYRGKGQGQKAQELLKGALDHDPEDFRTLAQLGNFSLQDGALDIAASYFERAKTVAPDNFNVRFNLGLAYSHQGQYMKAVDELEALYVDRPSFGGVREALAEIMMRLNRTDRAMELLTEAEEGDPDNANVQFLMGVILSKEGAWKKASLHLRKARTLQPGSREIARALGFALLNSGHAGDGATILTELADANPGSVHAQLDLAVALATVNSSGEALDILRKLEDSSNISDSATKARIVEVRNLVEGAVGSSEQGRE